MGNVFISSVSSLSFLILFLPCPSLSSPLLSLLSLFSFSLGDDTKWSTRVDNMLLNLNKIKILKFEKVYFTTCWCIWSSAGWVANSVDPGQMLILWYLIWVHTVCSGLLSQYLGFWYIFSSPEPKAQDELLWSLSICRPSVRPSVHLPFEQLLLCNHWASSFKFHVEPCVKGGFKIYTNGYGP